MAAADLDFETARTAYVEAMGTPCCPAWCWLESLEDWRRLAALRGLPWRELRPLLVEDEGGWVLRRASGA